MSILNRVGRGKVGGLSTPGPRVAEPTEPFAVKRTENAAAASPAFESAPVSERVIESTKHLRGVVPDADLRAIQETLADKLEADPMFVDLLHQAAGKP